MNGVHDMGGMHGFGAVFPCHADEPLFDAAWERRAFGLTLAMGATGQWNIDQSRAARESLAPATYLGSSYYRIWILALERLLLARALVRAGELKAGHAPLPLPLPGPEGEPQRACAARVLRADAVAATLARGAATARQPAAAARFVLGQRVRARNLHPPCHTRLPRYVRGHLGRVVQIHGAHVFADRHAASPPGQPFDEAPAWLYSVAFEGHELWGADAEPGATVSVDAWEPYLEAAP